MPEKSIRISIDILGVRCETALTYTEAVRLYTSLERKEPDREAVAMRKALADAIIALGLPRGRAGRPRKAGARKPGRPRKSDAEKSATAAAKKAAGVRKPGGAAAKSAKKPAGSVATPRNPRSARKAPAARKPERKPQDKKD